MFYNMFYLLAMFAVYLFVYVCEYVNLNQLINCENFISLIQVLFQDVY